MSDRDVDDLLDEFADRWWVAGDVAEATPITTVETSVRRHVAVKLVRTIHRETISNSKGRLQRPIKEAKKEADIALEEVVHPAHEPEGFDEKTMRFCEREGYRSKGIQYTKVDDNGVVRQKSAYDDQIVYAEGRLEFEVEEDVVGHEGEHDVPDEFLDDAEAEVVDETEVEELPDPFDTGDDVIERMWENKEHNQQLADKLERRGYDPDGEVPDEWGEQKRPVDEISTPIRRREEWQEVPVDVLKYEYDGEEYAAYRVDGEWHVEDAPLSLPKETYDAVRVPLWAAVWAGVAYLLYAHVHWILAFVVLFILVGYLGDELSDGE